MMDRLGMIAAIISILVGRIAAGNVTTAQLQNSSQGETTNPGILPGSTQGTQEDYGAALALELHNEYRKIHLAPPMKLDQELNEMALKCSKEFLAKHTIEDCLGLNEVTLHVYATNDKKSVKDHVRNIMEEWYSEVKDYSFDKPEATPDCCINFTQIVWKDSSQLGFALFTDPKSKIETVASAVYKPWGNQMYHQNGSNEEGIDNPDRPLTPDPGAYKYFLENVQQGKYKVDMIANAAPSTDTGESLEIMDGKENVAYSLSSTSEILLCISTVWIFVNFI